MKSSLQQEGQTCRKKLTADRLVYFPIYLKFMKELCPIIWVITLMMFYQNFSAASEKVLVPKTVYYICQRLYKKLVTITGCSPLLLLHFRTQTTKTGSSFSELFSIIYGVSQDQFLVLFCLLYIFVIFLL